MKMKENKLFYGVLLYCLVRWGN